MNHKEINHAIASLLEIPATYDLRYQLRIEESDLTLEEAQAKFWAFDPEVRQNYTITTSVSDRYCEDLNLAIMAAKRISEKNNYTFVLSIEDGEFKAAFGDYGRCCEYKGGNPAYCVCMCTLKFMGKV